MAVLDKEIKIIMLKGERGQNGQDGKSSYDLAVENELFSGTLEEWIETFATPENYFTRAEIQRVTQAEYDELVETGQVAPNCYYLITDDDTLETLQYIERTITTLEGKVTTLEGKHLYRHDIEITDSSTLKVYLTLYLSSDDLITSSSSIIDNVGDNIMCNGYESSSAGISIIYKLYKGNSNTLWAETQTINGISQTNITGATYSDTVKQVF